MKLGRRIKVDVGVGETKTLSQNGGDNIPFSER